MPGRDDEEEEEEGEDVDDDNNDTDNAKYADTGSLPRTITALAAAAADVVAGDPTLSQVNQSPARRQCPTTTTPATTTTAECC